MYERQNYLKLIEQIITYIKVNKFELGSTLEEIDLAHEIIADLFESNHAVDFKTGEITNTKNQDAFLFITTINKCKKTYNREITNMNLLAERIGNRVDSVSADNNRIVGSMAQNLLLNWLPKKDRLIWRLKMEGYAHKDIAAKLQITIEASRKRTQRAKRRLLLLLEKERKESLI